MTSSAFEVMLTPGSRGVGRSERKRLKREGENDDPLTHTIMEDPGLGYHSIIRDVGLPT